MLRSLRSVASEMNGAQDDTIHADNIIAGSAYVTPSQRSVSIRLRDVSRDGKRRQENIVLMMMHLCTVVALRSVGRIFDWRGGPTWRPVKGDRLKTPKPPIDVPAGLFWILVSYSTLCQNCHYCIQLPQKQHTAA